MPNKHQGGNSFQCVMLNLGHHFYLASRSLNVLLMKLYRGVNPSPILSPFQFVSCTLAKWWCIHQPVNIYTNCLKQYLICSWLDRSEREKLKKHGFGLKLFFSIFSKLTKLKLIKQLWSCKPMWHSKYSVN